MIKFQKIVSMLVYFGIAFVFSLTTFYDMTNETGTDGMILWRQVESKPYGIILAVLFCVLALIKYTEIKEVK